MEKLLTGAQLSKKIGVSFKDLKRELFDTKRVPFQKTGVGYIVQAKDVPLIKSLLGIADQPKKIKVNNLLTKKSCDAVMNIESIVNRIERSIIEIQEGLTTP